MVRRMVCALVVASAVAACGGGGGAGAETTTPNGNSSGLVPAAGELGATLQSDARTLRVLRAGARRMYQGQETTSAGSSTYTNAVTHTALATGVTESGSNPLNAGAESVDIRVESGAVRNRISLANFGLNEVLDAIELRSPVRVNDQYTHFDRRVPSAVQDLDGDGLREALDLGMWSTVVGEETVDLQHRHSLRTVRVDTTVLTRVRGSAQGQLSDVVRAVQSVWYAPGIGVVRIRAQTPNETNPRALDETREELEYWDGLTEGLGAMAPVPARGANGNDIGTVQLAAAFDQHAVVLAGLGADANQNLIYNLTKIDLRGQVLSSTEHSGIALGDSGLRPQALLRTGDALRLIGVQSTGSASIGMATFDADGRSLTGPVKQLVAGPVQSIDLGSTSVVAASSSQRVWLMWLAATPGRTLEPFTVDLMLAGFTADGTPLGEPVVVRSGLDSRSTISPQLAASGTQVLATWVNPDFTPGYLVANAASGAVLTIKQLADSPALVVTPLVEGERLVLGWRPGNRFGSAAAVVLDAAFNPVRNSVGNLGQEDVTPSWVDTSFSASGFRLDGSRLTLLGALNDRPQPWNLNTSVLQTFLDLRLPSGALSSATSAQWVARLALTDDRSQLLLSTASVVLPFSDRLLSLHGSQQGTVTVVSWRPAL